MELFSTDCSMNNDRLIVYQEIFQILLDIQENSREILDMFKSRNRIIKCRHMMAVGIERENKFGLSFSTSFTC